MGFWAGVFTVPILFIGSGLYRGIQRRLFSLTHPNPSLAKGRERLCLNPFLFPEMVSAPCARSPRRTAENHNVYADFEQAGVYSPRRSVALVLEKCMQVLEMSAQVLRKVNVRVEMMHAGVGSPRRTVTWVWESGMLALDMIEKIVTSPINTFCPFFLERKGERKLWLQNQ